MIKIIELWIRECEKNKFVKYEIKINEKIPYIPINPVLKCLNPFLFNKFIDNKPYPNVEKIISI